MDPMGEYSSSEELLRSEEAAGRNRRARPLAAVGLCAAVIAVGLVLQHRPVLDASSDSSDLSDGLISEVVVGSQVGNKFVPSSHVFASGPKLGDVVYAPVVSAGFLLRVKIVKMGSSSCVVATDEKPWAGKPWTLCGNLFKKDGELWEYSGPAPGGNATCGQPEEKTECSGWGEGCRKTGCCVDAKDTCFRKNAKWAACKKTCDLLKPDPHDLVDRTPWSCEKLVFKEQPDRKTRSMVNATVKDRSTCSSKFEDCRASSCCKGGEICFEKNANFAACQTECRAGQNLGEPKEFRTPWSCNILLPNGTKLLHSEWARTDA